jgi:hypothetical protein
MQICDVEGGEEGVASSEVDHGAEIGDGEDASGRAPALPETMRAYYRQPHRRWQSCSGGASLASLMYDEDVGSRDAGRRRREEAVSAYIDIPSVVVHRRARGPSETTASFPAHQLAASLEAAHSSRKPLNDEPWREESLATSSWLAIRRATHP